MRLESLTYDAFVARGVSPAVARFITAANHPIPHFDIFVRPVYEGWDYNVPPTATDVVGLWDENADATVRWDRDGQREFVKLYHDDPAITVVAWTEQGLLADLARRYSESLDWHDEESDRRRFAEFVRYIGFRHGHDLDAYLAVESHDADDFRSRFGRLP